MADRIKRRPDQSRDQLNTAAAGITAAGAAWTGPVTAGQVTAAAANTHAALTAVKNAKAALKVLEQTLRTVGSEGIAIMKQIDSATDALYGPAGAEKANFDLRPKGVTSGPAALDKLTDTRTFEDPTPNSIKFDWESIVGAIYELKWYSNAALTQLVGSATSTASEYVITGLTPGQQYWMIVRPVRGSETGPWSDPATRVANV